MHGLILDIIPGHSVTVLSAFKLSVVADQVRL